MAKLAAPSGFRDFLPDEHRKRQELIGRIRASYESFGFEGMDTPAMENLQVFLGKGGGENEKLMFRVLKRGAEPERAVAARSRSAPSRRAARRLQALPDRTRLDNLLVSGIRIDLLAPSLVVCGDAAKAKGRILRSVFITSLHGEISARIYFTMTMIGSFILIDWSNTGSATGLRFTPTC